MSKSLSLSLYPSLFLSLSLSLSLCLVSGHTISRWIILALGALVWTVNKRSLFFFPPPSSSSTLPLCVCLCVCVVEWWWWMSKWTAYCRDPFSQTHAKSLIFFKASWQQLICWSIQSAWKQPGSSINITRREDSEALHQGSYWTGINLNGVPGDGGIGRGWDERWR